MPEYITTLSISIIVAVVSARVTVFWALRRFREEQMWSRKADEYSAILEALHVAKEEVSEYSTDIEDDRDRSEKELDEARRNARDARQRVQQALDMGGLLLCPKANAALNEVLTGIDSAKKQQNSYDQARATFAAIKNCMDKMPTIAKEDLRLTGRWRTYWKWMTPHE